MKDTKSTKKTTKKSTENSEMVVIDFVPYYTKKEIDDMFAVFDDMLKQYEEGCTCEVCQQKKSMWQRFKSWLHKK